MGGETSSLGSFSQVDPQFLQQQQADYFSQLGASQSGLGIGSSQGLQSLLAQNYGGYGGQGTPGFGNVYGGMDFSGVDPSLFGA